MFSWSDLNSTIVKNKMCTNQVLKCLMFTNKVNESLRHHTLFAKPDPNRYKEKRTRMKVSFNKRLKVLTGIDATTTFRDLIAAILISSSSNPSRVEHEIDRYVICESMNGVVKCLDSTRNVRDELARIDSERRLLVIDGNVKIRHTMKLKSKIKCLPVNINVLAVNDDDDTETQSDIVVLEEFIGG